MITSIIAYKQIKVQNRQDKAPSFTAIKLSKYNAVIASGGIAALCINKALWDLEKAHIISPFLDEILTLGSVLAYCVYILLCNKFMKH